MEMVGVEWEKNKKTTRSHRKSFTNRKIVAVSGKVEHNTHRRKQWKAMENGWVLSRILLWPVCLFDLSVCDAHKKLSAISIVVQLLLNILVVVTSNLT